MLVIRVRPGRVVGHVDDLADLGELVFQALLDPELQGGAGRRAAVAAAAEANQHVAVLDVDQLHLTAVARNAGVDLGVEHPLHPRGQRRIVCGAGRLVGVVEVKA